MAQNVTKKPKVDALDYMRDLLADENAAPHLRLRAAICLAQYEHARLVDGGKKERAQSKADEVMESGKFAAARLPVKSKQRGMVNGLS